MAMQTKMNATMAPMIIIGLLASAGVFTQSFRIGSYSILIPKFGLFKCHPLGTICEHPIGEDATRYLCPVRTHFERFIWINPASTFARDIPRIPARVFSIYWILAKVGGKNGVFSHPGVDLHFPGTSVRPRRQQRFLSGRSALHKAIYGPITCLITKIITRLDFDQRQPVQLICTSILIALYWWHISLKRY